MASFHCGDERWLNNVFYLQLRNPYEVDELCVSWRAVVEQMKFLLILTEMDGLRFVYVK